MEFSFESRIARHRPLFIFRAFRHHLRYIVGLCYLGFYFVDYFYIPEHRVAALVLRLAVYGWIWVGMALLGKYQKIRKNYSDVVAGTLVVLSTNVINLMIYWSGSYKSIYIAGLILVMIANFEVLLAYSTTAALIVNVLSLLPTLFIIWGTAIQGDLLICWVQTAQLVSTAIAGEVFRGIGQRDTLKWAYRQLSSEREAVELRKQQQITHMAQQVAHDIRSPLAALAVVASDLDSLSPEKRYLLTASMDRIRAIANNLVNKSPELSRAGRSLRTEQLTLLIESIVSEKRLEFSGRKNIELRFDADSNAYGLFSRVEPVDFFRVLSNLINNSIEATEGRDGLIRLQITARRGEIQISILDNGKGISEGALERLGTRGCSFGKELGTGLGLYHARTSVEQWMGRLEARALDPGTEVSLILPQAPAPGWFLESLQIPPGQDIIVVDDDSSIHRVWAERLKAWISRHGGAISHFSSFPELLRFGGVPARATLLVDHEFTGLSATGLDLIEKLGLGNQAHLVTSRFDDETIRDRCTRLGLRIIPKPLVRLVPIVVG